MSFTFRPFDDIPADDWDALVRRSPDGWVFGLHGWQRLVTAVEEWGFLERGFGVCENDRLFAVTPLHFQPSTRSAASSGWGGSGPIIRRDLPTEDRRRVLRAATTHMIEIGRGEGAARLDVSSSPVTESAIGNRWGVNPFALLGFEDGSRLSQVIFLDQDEEALWAGLSKTARNLVRGAERAGFRVEQVDWPTSLDAYCNVHVETYSRSGEPPHPRAYFSGIAHSMGPIGAARLFALLSPGGEPVAFQNMAAHGVGAHYHTGCSRSGVQSIAPGYLLMWEAIKAAKADGFAWFDVGWIFPSTRDPKQKGLTHFKTRFGGEPHHAFHAALELSTDQPGVSRPFAADAPVQRGTPSLGVAGRIARRARRMLAPGAAP